MTRPDFRPLEPSAYASRGRSHPRAHPAFSFTPPPRRQNPHHHRRPPLFTTPPDQIVPSPSYTYEPIGSPFEDALSPALLSQETELGLGSLRGVEEATGRSPKEGMGGLGLGLGLGLGFGEDEPRIERRIVVEAETVELPEHLVHVEKRVFKDVKALIEASPNPDTSSFLVTNPALHLRNLKRRVSTDLSLTPPSSPRGSPDLSARYIDPLSPIPIFAPSGPSSPVVPSSPGPSQTTIALGVVLALMVLGVFGGVSLYFVKRRRRNYEADQLAEIEALEKGQGGGKGPPVEVDPTPLWGKRLSHFERESKRLGNPPAAVLRDQRRLSSGRSEKAKSRLSQSHLPVISEGGESDSDIVGRALRVELPMVEGVWELRLEGLMGMGSQVAEDGEGFDPAFVEVEVEDPEQEAEGVDGSRAAGRVSALLSRYSSDLLLSTHIQQASEKVEPVGPPNTPEQGTSDVQPPPIPSAPFLSRLAGSSIQGLHATAPSDSLDLSRPSSVSSSIYTSSSTDSLSTAPTDSPSMSTHVDSTSSFCYPPDTLPSTTEQQSVDASPISSIPSGNRPRSDSKSSSSVKSVKSVDLFKTAVGKRLATFSLPPASASTSEPSIYAGSIMVKTVRAEGITKIESPTRARPVSERTNAVAPPAPIIARPALTDPFSPSYTKVLVVKPPLANVQQTRRALISTFTSSSNSAEVNHDFKPFGITVKPSLLPQHHARIQARNGGKVQPRPATQYDSPPSPSPVAESSKVNFVASSSTSKGSLVAAALSRAASLPSKLPSMSSLNKRFLPSYTLPPSIQLPPLPSVFEEIEARPIVERAQTLPLPSTADALSVIPTISITDPNNSTHTPVSPSVSSSTCSSFASSFAFELGPAWTQGETGGRRHVEDDHEDDDEDDEEFAYDYQSHFAQFSFGRPEDIPEEDEDEEEIELDDDATIVGSSGRGRGGGVSAYAIGGDSEEEEEKVEKDGSGSSNFDSDEEEGYGELEGDMIDSLDSFPRVPSTIPQSPVA